MRVDVGCEFDYGTDGVTPAVVLVRPFSTDAQRVLAESWTSEPAVPFHDYVDGYGNLCRRLNLPPGRFRFRYAATVEVSGELDAFEPDARQLPVDALPDDALLYTLPSRYCLSDLLADRAWELFGATEPGWGRVQAICDFVHAHVRFDYGATTPATTAVDVFEQATGVCRDFAHLGVAFCRALNIPARYVFGYIPDIDVPVISPMDFCAWFEAYLGGEWWAFDPRNNERRRGRVVIGRGRDALDVAMVTTYGAVTLHEMIVRADRIEG